MKLPYTPACFTLLPDPSFPCSRLEGWRGGAGMADFGRLPPEEPGSTSRVFCSGTLWPQLKSRSVSERAPGVTAQKEPAAAKKQFF